MLKHLRKLFPDASGTSAKADNTASAEIQEEIIEMVKTETGDAVQASAVTTVADMASLSASVATLTASLATAEDKIATLSAALEEANKEKVAATANARKAKVVAAVGTEKADALLASLSSLTDPAFDAVMSAMATTSQVEASGKMFTEQGIDAEASVEAVANNGGENTLLAALQAKYTQK